MLAQELSRADDIGAGLAAYERAMRPMVEQGQGVPKLAPKLANPKTLIGIRVLHSVLNVASRPAIHKIAGKLFSRPPKAPDLSSYQS